MKYSLIQWHSTIKELPQPTQYSSHKTTWFVDEPLLVIWNGRVKPSQYDHKTKTWAGHTKEQIPQYWVTLKEIEILEKENNHDISK